MYEYQQKTLPKGKETKKETGQSRIKSVPIRLNKPASPTAAIPALSRGVIQRISASELYYDSAGEYEFDPNLKLNETHAGDLTFGVELEVVHDDESDIKKAINKANVEELTEATAEIDGKKSKANKNPELWSPVMDSSLKNNKGQAVGVEWVSPVFHMDNPKWNMIDELCQIIAEFHGTINETCSEHVHVGHAVLGNDRDKFDSLFLLYETFQDIIDIFARSGQKYIPKEGAAEERRLRRGADLDEDDEEHSGFARRMVKEEDETYTPYKGSELLDHYSPATLEAAIQYVEAARGEGTNATSLHSSYMSFVKSFLKDCDSLQTLAYQLARDRHIPQPGTFIKINKSKRQNISDYDKTIDTLKTLQRMVEMDIILKSYTGRFGGNPLLHEGRYRALNIHQNFDVESYKPTVEFRRFNGTIEAAAIEANAVLTTLLMNVAAEKESEEVVDFIDDAQKKNTAQRLFKFLDFITKQDEVKKLLLDAYIQNLTTKEYTDFYSN